MAERRVPHLLPVGVSVARTVARLLSDARARAHKPQEGQVRRGQAP